jgi:hypothetical protein
VLSGLPEVAGCLRSVLWNFQEGIIISQPKIHPIKALAIQYKPDRLETDSGSGSGSEVLLHPLLVEVRRSYDQRIEHVCELALGIAATGDYFGGCAI